MFIVLLLSVLMPLSLTAKAGPSQLSRKVIELRKEVELLNDEYKTEREKVLSELKSLTIQKAELAASLRSEEIRKKQFNEKISNLKKEMNDSSVESKELLPVINMALIELKTWVSESLPFKQKERLESLEQLEKKT